MIYMITEIINRYRWISIVDNDDEWGIKLSKLRGDNVPKNLGPVPIEWTPETINRLISDFPNFRSNVTCFSDNSKARYKEILKNLGVWIELYGLPYTGFYCTKVIDAIDMYSTDVKLDNSEYNSFHSPEFSPVLRAAAITNVDMFRIPQSISKRFVSERFKKEYGDGGFTGIEFTAVHLI